MPQVDLELDQMMILVTGATGLSGSYVVRELQRTWPGRARAGSGGIRWGNGLRVRGSLGDILMPSKLSVHIRDYPENIWDAVGRMQPRS